jgi:hypothetical protein
MFEASATVGVNFYDIHPYYQIDIWNTPRGLDELKFFLARNQIHLSVHLLKTFKNYQLGALLWSVSLEAQQLRHSMPILYGLALNYTLENRGKFTDFLNYLQTKRRQLLAALGLPSSKSAVKIMGRITFHSLTAELYELLMDVMCNQELNFQLQHIATIPATKLWLLNKDLSLIEAKLFDSWKDFELDEKGVLYLKALYRLIADTSRKAEPGLVRDEELLKITSTAELYELHNFRTEQLNRKNIDWRYVNPPLPVPEDDQITFVASADELYQLASRQHHCVASYEAQIAAGTYAVYKITSADESEVATLGLLRETQSLEWVVDQFKGARNSKPSENLQQNVNKWLTLHGKGLV